MIVREKNPGATHVPALQLFLPIGSDGRYPTGSARLP